MYALEKAITEKPVRIEPVYVGERKNFGEYAQDYFVVTLFYKNEKMIADFYMGIGNRIKKGERI